MGEYVLEINFNYVLKGKEKNFIKFLKEIRNKYEDSQGKIIVRGFKIS